MSKTWHLALLHRAALPLRQAGRLPAFKGCAAGKEARKERQERFCLDYHNPPHLSIGMESTGFLQLQKLHRKYSLWKHFQFDLCKPPASKWIVKKQQHK